MTDIVERLRATRSDWPVRLVALELESADEIDRLREALREIEAKALSLDGDGSDYIFMKGTISLSLCSFIGIVLEGWSARAALGDKE